MLVTKHHDNQKTNKPAGVSWFLGSAWQQRLRDLTHGYTVTLPHAISLPRDKNEPQISTWRYKNNHKKLFNNRTHLQATCIFLLQISNEAYMHLQEHIENTFLDLSTVYGKETPFNKSIPEYNPSNWFSIMWLMSHLLPYGFSKTWTSDTGNFHPWMYSQKQSFRNFSCQLALKWYTDSSYTTITKLYLTASRYKFIFY